MSLPARAACLRPECLLPESRAREFLDFKARVLEPQPPGAEHPVPCYMISKSHERTIRNMFLSSGMAVLVEETQVATRDDGRLLLAGGFSVFHKEHANRFVFDRRPQNFGEKRLGWARLPLGSQFVRLVLSNNEGIRGSGDDLRSWFYQLKDVPDALNTKHTVCTPSWYISLNAKVEPLT